MQNRLLVTDLQEVIGPGGLCDSLSPRRPRRRSCCLCRSSSRRRSPDGRRHGRRRDPWFVNPEVAFDTPTARTRAGAAVARRLRHATAGGRPNVSERRDVSVGTARLTGDLTGVILTALACARPSGWGWLKPEPRPVNRNLPATVARLRDGSTGRSACSVSRGPPRSSGGQP
jgi:hypothetical protein